MRILIFTINPLHNAPRVIREIDALKDDFEIIATGITPPHDSSVKFLDSKNIALSHFEYTLGKIYRVMLLGKVFLGKYATSQWKINRLLKDVNPDIVVVHPGAFLPYFFKKDRKYKIVFNAHEYHPLEVEGDAKWTKTWGKIYNQIYYKYLPKLDLLINVNQEIADQCELEFGVKSLVILNAARYFDLKKKPYVITKPLRFIHHGVPNPDRKLENMINAFRELGEGYELDLMLMDNGSTYYSSLKDIIGDIPNVRLINSVPYSQIIPFISYYDLGIYSLAPISFNNQMALPNKFFEFVQARLPIVIGPSPVMAKLVTKYGIGKIAEDFTAQSLIKTIRSIEKQELLNYRTNLEKAAVELSMERFDKILLKKIKELN